MAFPQVIFVVIARSVATKLSSVQTKSRGTLSVGFPRVLYEFHETMGDALTREKRIKK
jgi:predicted GIY-YIG superfamily endonuclease